MEITRVTEIQPQTLEYVIAGYGDRLVYHDYDHEKARLSAGKPLTIDTLRSCLKVVSDKFVDFDTTYNFSGLIPRNVIRFMTDEKKIIWWTPAQKRRLLFDSKLSVKTGIYPVPVLLWKLETDRLYVWALKSHPKSIADKICNAPFYNTADSGLICMGNARFTSDAMDYAEVMKVAETAFFNSYFTHASHSNLMKVDYPEFMTSQQEKPLESFPVKHLKVKSKTINSILGYDDNH